MLVVSADPAVRSGWADYFEALGMATLRCGGPAVPCVLLEGADCPLHEQADLAVYDRGSVTPELTLRLIRRSSRLPIAFARDRLDAHDRHEPIITALASEGVDACIGPSMHGRGR
jgi:hypothetical protein